VCQHKIWVVDCPGGLDDISGNQPSEQKCGFPLAEEQKKQITFSPHTWLGVWVQVCGGFQAWNGSRRCVRTSEFEIVFKDGAYYC